MKNYRWYRSDDGAIAGVCKGLAEAFELDTAIVRVFFVVFTLFGGIGPAVYIALIFSLPRKDNLHSALEPKILGVCGVLAKRFEIEVGIVRFLAILSACASFGLTFVGYVVLYFLLPEVAPKARDINK